MFLQMLLPFVSIVFVITIGVILLNQHFQKNLMRTKLEQEELKNVHQKELLHSSIHVQEEERKRIAQDMHDELGATLSITRMHLLQAERQYGMQNENLLSDLQNIRSLTESSLNNMRQISHQLMPQQLEEFGLVKSLETVVEQLNKTGDILIEIKTSAVMPDLSWSIKLALYRIFRELINNTIKHAGANRISIELIADSSRIVGHYNDNGIGIIGDNFVYGFGIKSIEGRANSVGGSISMGNGENGGFHAVINIPLMEQHH